MVLAAEGQASSTNPPDAPQPVTADKSALGVKFSVLVVARPVIVVVLAMVQVFAATAVVPIVMVLLDIPVAAEITPDAAVMVVPSTLTTPKAEDEPTDKPAELPVGRR